MNDDERSLARSLSELLATYFTYTVGSKDTQPWNFLGGREKGRKDKVQFCSPTYESKKGGGVHDRIKPTQVRRQSVSAQVEVLHGQRGNGTLQVLLVVLHEPTADQM